MKIDLTTIDTSNFLIKPVIFAGEACVLVNPQHIGAKYTRDTLKFRSSIWNQEGELVSAGFLKFFNWSEQPELDTPPTSLKGCRILEKLDGSLAIFDWHNGQLVSRTRGTPNSNQLENGEDFEYIKRKYPKIEEQLKRFPRYSLLAEIVSPNQRIVLNYGEPVEAYLIGLVDKRDYSYFPQGLLNELAEELGMPRPRQFEFDSIDNMLVHLEDLKGMEGFCVYYNNSRSIRKAKGAWYLALHRLKSEISNLEKLIELWLSIGQPTFQGFQQYLADTFDWEIATMALADCSKICDAGKTMHRIVEGMQEFADRVKSQPRKDAAIAIISAYGKETNRAGYVFKLLDGKTLDKDAHKKLMLQLLKGKHVEKESVPNDDRL